MLVREQLLSPKQIVLVHHLSHGLTISQAAEAMEMPFETARWLLKRTRHAYGAKNTTHLIAKALRDGLIE
jgi:DNA-directed RNA polymerase specialized sigma24 family protein